MFAAMSLMVALLVLLAPETRNQPLAQTVQEAELLTRGNEKNYAQLLAKVPAANFCVTCLFVHANEPWRQFLIDERGFCMQN